VGNLALVSVHIKDDSPPYKASSGLEVPKLGRNYIEKHQV
jgi:hypothetical protein